MQITGLSSEMSYNQPESDSIRVNQPVVQWVMTLSHWSCLLHPSHKVNAKVLLLPFKKGRGQRALQCMARGSYGPILFYTSGVLSLIVLIKPDFFLYRLRNYKMTWIITQNATRYFFQKKKYKIHAIQKTSKSKNIKLKLLKCTKC